MASTFSTHSQLLVAHARAACTSMHGLMKDVVLGPMAVKPEHT
jgi:hypothetical protein